MEREQEQISPISMILTVLLHVLLFTLGSTRFSHHHRNQPVEVIVVSIPVFAKPTIPPEVLPDINDLLSPPQALIQPNDVGSVIDPDHYYLPGELSQQVQVLQDDTASLNIAVRELVTMTLYINEAGTVDDVIMDEQGNLSPAEQQRVLRAFGQIRFFPGMRGEKVVKSQVRIALEINRKITITRN